MQFPSSSGKIPCPTLRNGASSWVEHAHTASHRIMAISDQRPLSSVGQCWSLELEDSLGCNSHSGIFHLTIFKPLALERKVVELEKLWETLEFK